MVKPQQVEARLLARFERLSKQKELAQAKVNECDRQQWEVLKSLLEAKANKPQ
jgi:hypothetical protein